MSVSEGKGLLPIPFKCTDTITQYKFVTLDVTECTKTETVVEQADVGNVAEGTKIIGITATKTTAANQNVTVNMGGVCYLTVNGSGTEIVVNDRLKSDASGIGIKIAADHDEVGAIALVGSTTSGEIIPVLVKPYTLHEE